MIRAALVTNWGDHCSIAQYAKNLVDHFPIDCGVDLRVVSHPLTFENIYDHVHNVDVIHVNFLSYWMTESLVEKLGRVREPGQKIVVTYQETTEYQLKLLGECPWVDAIVIHEPKGEYHKKVHKIPNGIRLVNTVGVEWTRKLGSAGFASGYKRFDRVAQTAKDLNLGCLLLTPQAVCGDQNAANKMARDMKQIHPDAEVVTDWLPYEKVVRYLAECMAVVFPYDETAMTLGIGNAVRFGLASGRPVIVSHHSHFRDLLDYQDEVYFIEKDLETTVRQVMVDVENNAERLPNRLLRDMNWDRVSMTYAKLYGDVIFQSEGLMV